MEYIVPFLGTLFGSAGLMSVIAALISRSRHSKARRYLEDAKVAREVVKPGSHEAAVLDQSIATTTLRLASSTFWIKSIGQRIVVFVSIGILTVFVGAVFATGIAKMFQAGWGANSATNIAGVLVTFVIYVGFGVAMLVYAEQRTREESIYKELLQSPIVVETDEIRRARKARRRRRAREKRAAKWADKKWARARLKVEARREAGLKRR
ncbi:MAG: hypothetical protein ACK5MR_13815 [Cumulibacter sp.]